MALAEHRWGFISTPESRLGRHFRYLKLAPGAVAAYLADYERFRGSLPTGSWPDEVYTGFLLSTTFFKFDGDTARPVSYVAFYDPLLVPCINPLARFDEV